MYLRVIDDTSLAETYVKEGNITSIYVIGLR